MNYEPHRLYLIDEAETQYDASGNPDSSGVAAPVYVCGCFLHDVTVAIMRGYAGTGVHPKYYVNLDRRDDLTVGQEILVTEQDGTTERGRGKIVDVRKTGGMRYGGLGEYMTVYIE
jgi:hypothetical protein